MNTTNNADRFTDLTIVGTAADIRALALVATRAGVLVQHTAPRPAAPGDARLKATFRLHLHHR